MVEITMARKTAAYKIHMDIMAAGEVAAESFSTFCRLLKTMRDDKLYEALEYSSFEAYCENAVGISYRQSLNYIKVLENFGETNLNSSSCLGIKKLQLLGTVPEESREQFIDQNKLQDMTTRQVEAAVKEYKEKLRKAEEEAQRAKEFADKQSKFADEHMMRARQAEKEVADKEISIQSLRLDKNMKEKDIINLQQQLEQAKRNGDPAKVQELGKKIADYQEEIEDYQQQIGNLNQQLAEKDKQLHEKPIEVPATKIIEKVVVPDEVRDAIYNKVFALYDGLANLTDKEIQIFAEQSNPNDYGDIHESLEFAIGIINKIDSAVFDFANPEPDNQCMECALADMDKVTEEQLENNKTYCTVTSEIVDFGHTCNKFKEHWR